MSDHILFDNLLVTDSLLQAEEWAADSFDIKRIKLDKQAVRKSKVCNVEKKINTFGYFTHIYSSFETF
jgi:hypothetical protein